MAKTEIIKLNMLGLPVIQSIDDFSVVTHISKYTIYQLSHHSDKYYKIFEIPKKSGGKRTICQPSKKLKGLQSWILVNILNKIQVSPSCKGFRKGSSTLDNALPHIGANTILNLDLKDFFPTVNAKQVYNVFKTIGYNKLVATVFTNICTYKEMLPQGSPCSPMLANLTAWTLDLRIQGYVGKRGISYTRYADDLSFSGLNPSKVVKIIPMIKTIIDDEKFIVNNKKTRIASSAKAKIVTGLIVNEDNVGIGKQKYKDLRAKIHHLTLPTEQYNEKLLNHIGGWLSYLNSVDKLRLQKAKKYIAELTKKHPKTLIARLDT
jgi:retron-type reverse transcriptase